MSIQRVTNPDTLFKNCFKLDGKVVKTPNKWAVIPQILCTDSKRLVKTGEVKSTYIGTILQIEWTYYNLNSKDYEDLFDTYIVNLKADTTHTNKKSIYHTITTLDSNHSGKMVKDYQIYTQNDFKAPPAHVRFENGEMIYYYEEVTFTFIGRYQYSWDSLVNAVIDTTALTNS